MISSLFLSIFFYISLMDSLQKKEEKKLKFLCQSHLELKTKIIFIEKSEKIKILR